MEVLFIAFSIIFCTAEIVLLTKLLNRGDKIGVKSTAGGLGGYILIMLTIYIIKLNIPYYVLFLSTAALFIDSYFGYYRECYERYTTFDRYVHGYGAFSFALLFYFLIINLIGNGGSKLYQAMFVLFLGISLGAIFEIFEFIADVRNGSQMQKGLKDTNLDIISNVIGSAAAAILSYFAVL